MRDTTPKLKPIGFVHRESALRASRIVRVEPRAAQLEDGTWAALGERWIGPNGERGVWAYDRHGRLIALRPSQTVFGVFTVEIRTQLKAAC